MNTCLPFKLLKLMNFLKLGVYGSKTKNFNLLRVFSAYSFSLNFKIFGMSFLLIKSYVYKSKGCLMKLDLMNSNII